MWATLAHGEPGRGFNHRREDNANEEYAGPLSNLVALRVLAQVGKRPSWSRAPRKIRTTRAEPRFPGGPSQIDRSTEAGSRLTSPKRAMGPYCRLSGLLRPKSSGRVDMSHSISGHGRPFGHSRPATADTAVAHRPQSRHCLLAGPVSRRDLQCLARQGANEVSGNLCLGRQPAYWVRSWEMNHGSHG
jgi:hypothetical protein